MSDPSPKTAGSPSLSRRTLLQAAAGLAAAAGPATGAPAASPPTVRLENDDAVDAALPHLSNWGRWGAQDQLGTLNLITPQMRVAAAGTVTSGRVVPLGREFSVHTPELRNFSYRMVKYTDAPPEEAGCYDIVGMTCHGFAVTHVDALCHIFTPEGREGMYNGHPVDAVTDEGSRRLGIEHVGATGIVGRGVLLDIAGLRGDALKPGSTITPDDLDAAERLQNVRVGPGDIVFVRNGAGASNTYRLGTGLHASCLSWLRSRDVAVLSSDSDSDIHPAPAAFMKWPEPMHMVGIPYMGLTLLDHAELDGLAAACAQEGRWSFFVTTAPWRFRGATGSVVNPLAMF